VRVYHRRFEASAQVLLKIPLEVLSKTSALFFVAIAVFIGLNTLTFGNVAARVLSSAVTIALFWQAGLWATATASAWLEHKRSRGVAADLALLGSFGIIVFIVNSVIWSFVLLLTLDNLRFDITALVARLGIGGNAVALALQNIFGDLFASLS